MRTKTMNAKLVLASAAVVLGAIGATEVLKPAEAHAVGEKVAAAQDASAQLSAMANVISGVKMSDEFKAKTLKTIKAQAKTISESQTAEVLLKDIESGRPDAADFKRMTYLQVLDKARADLADAQKRGATATSDPADYENNQSKRLYVGSDKTAKKLNTGPLNAGGAKSWWDVAGHVAGWSFDAADGTLKDIAKGDREAIISKIDAVLGFGMMGDVKDLVQAIIDGNWEKAGAALLSIAVTLLSMFVGGPLGFAMGLAAALIGAMVDKFTKRPSDDQINNEARKLRDEAYRQALEPLAEKIAARLLLGAYKMEYTIMYSTAILEAAIENGLAHDKNIAASDVKRLDDLRATMRKELNDEMRRQNGSPNALIACDTIPGSVLCGIEPALKEMDKQPIKQQPLSDLPALTEAGIKRIDGIVPAPSDERTYFLFSDKKVARLWINDENQITVKQGLTELKDGGWKSAVDHGFTKVDAVIPEANTNRVYVLSGTKYFSMNSNGSNPSGIKDVSSLTQGKMSQVGAVISAGTITDSTFNGTRPAYWVFDGEKNQFIQLSAHSHQHPDRFPDFTILERGGNIQPITDLGGFTATDMKKNIKGAIKLPGSNVQYVFDADGSFAKIAISGDASAPGTLLADFTGSWVDKNLEALYDAGKLPGSGNAKAARGDQLKRAIMPDDPWLVGAKFDNYGYVRKHLLPLQEAPAYKPSVAPQVGKTYTIMAAHSGKMADATNKGDVMQWFAHGGKNQQWNIQAGTNPGEVKLESQSEGKCLSSRNSSVQLDDCKNHGTNWVPKPTEDGFRLLATNVTNKSLDVKDASKNDGAPLVLWDSGNGPNQRFYFSEVPTSRASGDSSGDNDSAGAGVGTETVSVNSFGKDYSAQPGAIVGKDGKDGLKTEVRKAGEPAKGVEVAFTVPEDSGLYFDHDGQHVTRVTVTTGDDGTATAPLLHAGDKEGDFTVTMTAINEAGATQGEHPTGTYTVKVKK